MNNYDNENPCGTDRQSSKASVQNRLEYFARKGLGGKPQRTVLLVTLTRSNPNNSLRLIKIQYVIQNTVFPT